MFTYILYTAIGAALVLVGADRLTDGAVGLAVRFGISEMVIGLTIVAFGTSLPEFIVSFLASLSDVSGATALSVSNIVGSNLFNVMVIAGASAALSPIVISQATVRKDIPLCLLAKLDKQRAVLRAAPSLEDFEALFWETLSLFPGETEIRLSLPGEKKWFTCI